MTDLKIEQLIDSGTDSVAGGEVEAVARLLCTWMGTDPDALVEAGNVIGDPIDVPAWQLEQLHAREMIAAISAYRQRQSGGGDEIVERCAALAERLEASDEYALGDGPTIATEIRKLKGAKPIALPRAPARPLSGEVREAVARIVEDAIARHDVSRAYHEGTLDDADAILSILALTRVTDRAGELDEIHAYLLGEGQLQGCWFGEPAPKGRRGAYWWRTNLRAAIQTGGEKR